jgi:5-methylcytosine-specific restriction protein A
MPKAVPTYKPPRQAQASRHREYDRTRRDAERKAFYHTQAWLKLRALKLSEIPYCEACYKSNRLVQATHVHHLVEVKDDWDLRLDMGNLQSLCHPCHSRLHRCSKGILL